MLKSAGLLIAFLLLMGVPVHAAQIVSAPTAQQQVKAGEITLIDIRRPEEWHQSGVAASAKTLSMHDDGFLAGLEKLTGGDKSKPLALICRTGARSTWLSGELKKRGYTNVLNVREGMFGSQAGPGWLKRGLPVREIR